jgi:hypothetical protein
MMPCSSFSYSNTRGVTKYHSGLGLIFQESQGLTRKIAKTQ